MKRPFTRRSLLGRLAAATACLVVAPAVRAAKAAVKTVLVSTGAPKGYDPTQHKWLMVVDVNRCIGCGLCAEACKLENHVPECEHSPCVQVCPVGATFDAPDGAVLIDPKYCIGCGFCIQACPYGCRFMNPVTHTAEKCTLCYHRISRGLKPACVEICPTQARIFGDLKNPEPDDPIEAFVRNNKVQVLKPHLGTEPRVLYAGIDREVR